jgi:hypothetical protein
LHFGSWTNVYLSGTDFSKISGNVQLRGFQYVELDKIDDIVDRIEVEVSEYNVTDVEY